MAKTYISNYPNISTTIKRYVDLSKVTFLSKAHIAQEEIVLLQFNIYHETESTEPITPLDATVELLADNNTQVYSLTGEYLEYDNSTIPPKLLHTNTKGQPVGEFDFFQSLKAIPTVINDLVTFAINRADITPDTERVGYNRLDKYIK